MRNYLEKWAAVDAEGEGQRWITVGDYEPRFFMGRFDWSDSFSNGQVWYIPLNETGLSIVPGTKRKIKIFAQIEN